MKAAIRALNEDNAAALTTALESLEDVNAVSFFFRRFFFHFTKPLLYQAAEKLSIPLATVLLAKGADPNKLCASTGLAPIHMAAPNTDLFKLLLSHHGNYSLPDGHQKEPVFYAVDKNNEELVHFLLEKDGTVATRCNDKRTPLHDCAERGFIEIARDLLDHGADVNAQNWVTFLFTTSLFHS
jgi:ankyrin repeat protein